MVTEVAAGAYEAFRDDLRQELERQVEGFVRIGYKLKQARDTGILEGSGYKDYKEFAWAEYRLDGSITSRYISINDRYSVGGNSEVLKPEYQGYGYTKLAEMLSIPDEIAETLNPSLSKMDIRQIAGEIKEENSITDLEVLMEGQQEEQKEMPLIRKVMHQYFYDQRKSFAELASILARSYDHGDPERVMDVLAPAGTAVIFVRIRGIGKIMVHIKGSEQDIHIQNTRTMETVTCDWKRFCCEMKAVFQGWDLTEPEKAWEAIYREPYREADEKVQESSLSKRSEKKKPVSKVVVSPKKEKIAPAQMEKGPEQKEQKPENGVKKDENMQIPGQDSILNHPELLPEDCQTAVQVDGETVPAEVEPTAAQRKEECLSLINAVQGNIVLEKYEEAYRAAGQLLQKLEVMKC